MTYWVQNDATRKILVGLVVLLVVLAVGIPLTLFALGDDEDDLEITRVGSTPAVASITPWEADGPGNGAAAPEADGPGNGAAAPESAIPAEATGPESDPVAATQDTPLAASEPAGGEAEVQEPVADLSDRAAPVAITVAPAAGESGERDLTITVYSPFQASSMDSVRVEAVQEGPVWFLPNTFEPAPYISRENPETVSFLVWESLELPAGENLKIQGKVRAADAEAFTILAYVEADTEVLVHGSAEKNTQ